MGGIPRYRENGDGLSDWWGGGAYVDTGIMEME